MRPARRTPFTLAALALALALTLWLLSLPGPYLTGALYDIGIPYDAGWRLRQGIWPSLDYLSPIGPVYAGLQALAQSLLGPVAKSLLLADALALLLALGLLLAAGQGLPDAGRAALILAAASAGLTIAQLDGPWYDTRFLAAYNRWAWALSAAPLAWAFTPARPGLSAGLACGLALALLLLLKLPMAAGALGTVGLSLLLRPRRLWLPLGLPVAAPLLLAGALGLVTGYWMALAADLRLIIAANAGESVRWAKLAATFIPNALEQAAMPVAVLGLLALAIRLRASRPALLLLGSLLCLTVGSLQNHDRTLVYPGALVLILLLRLVREHPLQRWVRAAAVPVALAAMLALVALPGRLLNGLSRLPEAWAEGVALGPEGSLLAGLRFGPLPAEAGDAASIHPRAESRVLAAEMAALAAALREEGGGPVVTLGYSNLAALLGPEVSPAPGPALWWDWLRTWSETAHPPPEQVFAGARLVVTGFDPRLEALYRPWLEQRGRMLRVVGGFRLWGL